MRYISRAAYMNDVEAKLVKILGAKTEQLRFICRLSFCYIELARGEHVAVHGKCFRDS
jgi:hypothetical protein